MKSEKKLTKGRLLKLPTFKPSTTWNWAPETWCIHLKSQFYHRLVYSVDQGSISLDCLFPNDFFFSREWQPTPHLPDSFFGYVNIITLTPMIKFCRLGSFSISLRWFCPSSLWLVALLLFFSYFYTCHMTCGILVPWTGIEPMPLQWECGVLTTGLPGKSLTRSF